MIRGQTNNTNILFSIFPRMFILLMRSPRQRPRLQNPSLDQNLRHRPNKPRPLRPNRSTTACRLLLRFILMSLRSHAHLHPHTISKKALWLNKASFCCHSNWQDSTLYSAEMDAVRHVHRQLREQSDIPEEVWLDRWRGQRVLPWQHSMDHPTKQLRTFENLPYHVSVNDVSEMIVLIGTNKKST